MKNFLEINVSLYELLLKSIVLISKEIAIQLY